MAKKRKKDDRKENSPEVSRRKENSSEASRESWLSKQIIRAKKYKKVRLFYLFLIKFLFLLENKLTKSLSQFLQEKREIVYKLNALVQQGKLSNLIPKKKRHMNPSSEASKYLGSVKNMDPDSLELAKESSVIEEEEEDEELDFDPREPKFVP